MSAPLTETMMGVPASDTVRGPNGWRSLLPHLFLDIETPLIFHQVKNLALMARF